MKREQLAIIGNGMATNRLLDELVRRQIHRRTEITVFGEEPQPCYNRILLNHVLLGDNIQAITLKSAAWFVEHGIRLVSGARVTRLSAGAKRLWTEDGREFSFDRAVFATGSVPRIPCREGAFLPNGRFKTGVTAYRTVADCEQMRTHAKPGRRAVVIGGGLLGLEAAKGLCDLGMRVTVLHVFDILMNRQLDRIGGGMLRRAVEDLGISVRTSVSTKAILGRERVEAVQLGGGEPIPADLVVFAGGIQPRIDLARDSDIATNAGILVDDRLRTDIPDIFAVGECVEHDGRVYGTVGPVYEQCTVLADVLSGTNGQSCYRGSKVYTRLKVVGLEVAGMGETDAKEAGDEVIQIVEEHRRCYRKLIIRRNRLIGAILVGDTSAAAALVRRFERGDPLPTNRLDLFASEDRANETVEDVLCRCAHVPEAAVMEAIRSGCRSLRLIGERTGAGTGCGSCRGRMSALLLKTNPAREPLELTGERGA